MTPDQAPHPHQDPRAKLYREEFKRRRKREQISNIILLSWIAFCLITIAVPMFGGEGFPKFAIVLLSSVLLGILFSTLFQLINNRCPCCAKNLGRLRALRFCFNCGIRFRD